MCIVIWPSSYFYTCLLLYFKFLMKAAIEFPCPGQQSFIVLYGIVLYTIVW